MSFQPRLGRVAPVSVIAAGATALTLCVLLPLVLAGGGPLLWAALLLGVVGSSASSSIAVWRALDDRQPPTRRSRVVRTDG